MPWYSLRVPPCGLARAAGWGCISGRMGFRVIVLGRRCCVGVGRGRAMGGMIASFPSAAARTRAAGKTSPRGGMGRASSRGARERGFTGRKKVPALFCTWFYIIWEVGKDRPPAQASLFPLGLVIKRVIKRSGIHILLLCHAYKQVGLSWCLPGWNLCKTSRCPEGGRFATRCFLHSKAGFLQDKYITNDCLCHYFLYLFLLYFIIMCRDH